MTLKSSEHSTQTKRYMDSKPDQMGEVLINTFKNNFLNQNGYRSFNKPRSKAYISVSKTIPGEIYKMDKSDLIDLLKNEMISISEKSEKFENGINSVFNT